MPTVNYDLPTPADGTLVSAFPKTLRESNITVDAVLKTQGNQVQQAKNSAQTARDAAVDAAGLVGTPPDTAIAAAVGATNSQTRHNLSKALDTNANPALGKLHASMLRCHMAPVGNLFLGSSSTAGSTEDPSDRYVNIVTKKLQMKYAAGPGAETAVQSLTGQTLTIPGIHGYNLGEGGLTSRNFLTTNRLNKIAAVQPAAIYISIGANDAIYGYTAAEVKANILSAVETIDAVMDVQPVYVLIHQHQLDSVDISALWAAYREEIRAIAIDDPEKFAFIDASYDFASIGIPGADPYGFRKPDHVHLEALGQHFLGELVAQGLRLDEQRTTKGLLGMDSFARTENVELGFADSGQRWLGAANWTILNGGAATKTGGGTPLIMLDSADMDVSADVELPDPGVTTFGGICVRSLDTNNRLSVLISGATQDRVSLYSMINGVQTVRWTELYDFTDGGTYNVRSIVRGREMSTYINGKLINQYRINPADQAVIGRATGAGFHSSAHSSGRRFRNFKAYEAQ